ncbi:MAG: acetylglutamate kinase [Coriobacteriales bacterium]|jgi:acetylglutamate kinase|nr:acetylglutamate kinase [Coriobacteriales bacterium]
MSRKEPQTRALNKAEVLIEALPWIKEATGKTVVIKYGGAAMVDAELRESVMSDIVLMKIIGLNPIVVHGGGRDITHLSEQLGLPAVFKDGMRVTPPELMDVVKMALIGKVNQELVAQLNKHGHIAVGLNGADGHIVKAKRISQELGMVGRVEEIDTTLLADLIDGDYVPLIASVAVGADGLSYNVNADVVAGEIAAAIGAHKVIFLTDVDGLYRDFADKSTLISRLNLTEARALLAKGLLAEGMLPKLQSCVQAVSEGVFRAHILNGTLPHALLLEIFTNEGVGTMIMPDEEERSQSSRLAAPLDGLAGKLHGLHRGDGSLCAVSQGHNPKADKDCTKGTVPSVQ